MGNILLSGARVLYAATSATAPDETTVAYGAAMSAWPAGWADVGYTNAPVSMNWASEVYDVMAEQSTLPVESIVVSETVKITTSLIDITGANLKLAVPGSTATDTTATTAQKPFTAWEFGGAASRDTYQWCFEGARKDAANNSQPVRLIIFKGQPVLNGNFELGKNKEASLQLEITAVEDTTKDAGKRLGVMHIVTGPLGS